MEIGNSRQSTFQKDFATFEFEVRQERIKRQLQQLANMPKVLGISSAQDLQRWATIVKSVDAHSIKEIRVTVDDGYVTLKIEQEGVLTITGSFSR